MRGKGQQLSLNPCRGRGRTRRRAGRAARRGGLTSQVEVQQETAVLTRKSRPRWKQHCPQDRAALRPPPPLPGDPGKAAPFAATEKASDYTCRQTYTEKRVAQAQAGRRPPPSALQTGRENGGAQPSRTCSSLGCAVASGDSKALWK